ncbi:MAG: DsbA family protein [Paracoccus sp. (in: a-proteobacteria)]|uniref:DsbA family protein n=1 Tax=Paracoccus sp. TaxID=267 RepID=UPI0026DEA6F8|nr:DsbA family protein [Paracoccus sp. (in: a-proteobacteria)]MDO5620497.1 DsbA family protein [Paracoccus sp. (in: a-proteobacteria)]
MTRTTLAALALTTALAAPALAFDPANMTDTEKAAFGDAVRSYLIDNPEVLLEAINGLEAKQAEQAVAQDRVLIDQHHQAIFNDADSWSGGNPQGDITMVEFIDYKCGVCRRFAPDVENAVSSDGNIRIIFKEYPILGPESELAARFALAVRQLAGDEAYKKAHDALMILREPVNDNSLTKLANELGVDAAATLDRMKSDDVTRVLMANAELGNALGIQGTPTFVIGDQILRGVPRAGIKPTVDDIRAQMAADKG